MEDNRDKGKPPSRTRTCDDANEIVALLGKLDGVGSQGLSLSQAMAAMTPVTERIRLIVGEHVADALNSYHGDRVGDLNEKRDVARSLNDLLDGLGLRIKCPNTGRGATLIGQVGSQGNQESRFRLRVAGSKITTASSATFPKVDVVVRDMNEKPRGRPVR